MHKSHDDASDELERKRLRNRVAQRKYRKRLRSRIEELEKRAAVAVQLPNPPRQADASSDQNILPTFQPEKLGNAANVPISVQNLEFQGIESWGRDPATARTIDAARANTTPTVQSSLASLANDIHLMSSHTTGCISDEMEILRVFQGSGDLVWDNGEVTHERPASDIKHANQQSMQQKLPHTFTSRHDSTDSAKIPIIFSPRVERASPATDLREADLESRVAHVLKSIQMAGFDSADSFISSYYTGIFKEKSPARKAQESSRSKGLPQLLEELRTHSGSWFIWEFSRYRDATIRSAASLIADEFDHLKKKQYDCEIELRHGLIALTSAHDFTFSDTQADRNRQLATELKRTLQNELPNMHILITALSSHSPQLMRDQLFSATVQVMAAPTEEPVAEIETWLQIRRGR